MCGPDGVGLPIVHAQSPGQGILSMVENSTDLQLASEFEPATREAWRALVDKVLKGSDFEQRLVSRTLDDLRIAPLYTRADALPGAEAARPGEAPYARGFVRPGNAAGWDIRQLQTATDPNDANAAILEDLRGGATSIALHIASPGHSGLQPTREAFAAALEKVPLDSCGIA